MRILHVFCEQQFGTSCPELGIDPNAPHDQQVVVKDDFGNSIRMSQEQWAVLAAQASGTSALVARELASAS